MALKTVKTFFWLSLSVGSGLVFSEDTLTGDWNGVRSKWADAGAELELVYTGEYYKVSSGGLNRKSETLDNVDVTLSLDGDKLFGLKGSQFFLYILGNSGGSPSEHAGDLQGVSNIDAPDAWKVYEAWYDQSFADDRASVRFGLYDLNSEFDVIESAGLFIHASFGIGPDYSQSGQNGPSIFPTTSLALRLAYAFNEHYFIQAAVLDAVPGDLNNDQGTHIDLDSDDGELYALEFGYTQGLDNSSDRYGKLALGAWRYSENFDDLMDIDSNSESVQHDDNSGWYILGEYNIFREDPESTQGAMVFARYGMANDDVNQLESYFGAGVVYTGLLPGRDNDQLGLAIAVAENGNKYQDLERSLGNSVDDREIAVELSYRMQVLPWLAIQPDIQWIKNPGTNSAVDDATLFGVRTEVVF